MLLVRSDSLALHVGRTCFRAQGVAIVGQGHRLWDYALRGDVTVNSDDANEAQLIDVLDTFCLGFARRDPEAVLRVCVPELDLVVVTSEEPLLRGPTELRRFLDRYVEGETTYSWEWERHDISSSGSVAWLLAEGTEIAASEDQVVQHPYRMTMVLERREGDWLLRHVHGSSPH
jgi:hypothetical protein